MKLRRILLVFLCLTAMLFSLALLTATTAEVGERNEDATAEFRLLLNDLARAAEEPGSVSKQTIRSDLRAIRALNTKDYEIARSIAGHWEKTFLDSDYRLCLYDGGDRAEALEGRGVPHGAGHAIVVLGYELRDGEMQPELKGRCEAAAAVARSFPEAIVVCSGGATGLNNTEGHTEAGRMRDYLTEVCGLDSGRIFIDERAMSTLENAVNTFRILREQGAHTMTIVTSSYHQRWSEAVYNAQAAVVRQESGYSVTLTQGFSYDTEPGVEAYRHGARIAAMQIAGILGIPASMPGK